MSYGQVRLRLGEIVAGDPSRDFVPFYHFRILIPGDVDVGHINFRVGDNFHIRQFAGHIGFEIREPYRGRGLALDACRAMAPLVRSLYPTVRITCDPENAASIRTIERLGARFLDEVVVPPHAPHFLPGMRRKQRYDWTP
jgi:tagatose 1,6-diphosphate aldolase